MFDVPCKQRELGPGFRAVYKCRFKGWLIGSNLTRNFIEWKIQNEFNVFTIFAPAFDEDLVPTCYKCCWKTRFQQKEMLNIKSLRSRIAFSVFLTYYWNFPMIKLWHSPTQFGIFVYWLSREDRNLKIRPVSPACLPAPILFRWRKLAEKIFQFQKLKLYRKEISFLETRHQR